MCAEGPTPAPPSRFTGYQMLCCAISPYASAGKIIATPPAIPPLIPLVIGYVSTGRCARCSGPISQPPYHLRVVVIVTDCTTTGNSSCASCGSTCRNHPTHPASISTAPKAVTQRFVTSPAAAMVQPKASTMGHAVGAGKWIVSPCAAPAPPCDSSCCAVSAMLYLPTMYTTVKTTTHTASTKCQYSANT